MCMRILVMVPGAFLHSSCKEGINWFARNLDLLNLEPNHSKNKATLYTDLLSIKLAKHYRHIEIC